MNRDDAKLEESPTGTAQENEEIFRSREDARLTRRKRPDGHSVLVKQAIGSRGNRPMTHEAGILQRFDHIPGVIKIAAVAGESNTLMPSTLMLSDDGSMALERFMRSSTLSVAQVVDYAQAVACVLSGVHQAGVIHNDICPASLLIHPQTLQPTLIDFSNAVVISERQAGAEGSGEIVCNWSYMSPERTGRIGRSPDARSDLYSLGITLYELLTQRKPFDTEDLLELMHDHLVRVPEAPCSAEPAVPRIVSDLVLHLLEK